MSKEITYARYPKLRKRKVTKTYEQGFGQNGGVSSLGTTYEDLDSDGVLDTIVKNSPRIGAFKRTVGVVNRPYLPQPAPVGPVDNPPTVTTPFADVLSTGAPVSLILPNHFTDPEGDPITYVVSSSDATVASVTEVVTGTWSVTAGATVGVSTITVTATANGKSTTASFTFTNPPPFNIDLNALTQAQILARTGDAIGTTAFATDTEDLYVFDGVDWLIFPNI